MCDYSLMAVPNRLAQEGEELVMHRFPTGSLGLASPVDLKPAARPPALPERFGTCWCLSSIRPKSTLYAPSAFHPAPGCKCTIFPSGCSAGLALALLKP